MGDSDFALYLSVVAILVMVGSVIAFIIAWRVRKRPVRIVVGVLLLAVAALCAILSFLATLIVAALGVASLVLAGRTQTQDSSRPKARRGTDP
jgi:hypothetical protein